MFSIKVLQSCRMSPEYLPKIEYHSEFELYYITSLSLSFYRNETSESLLVSTKLEPVKNLIFKWKSKQFFMKAKLFFEMLIFIPTKIGWKQFETVYCCLSYNLSCHLFLRGFHCVRNSMKRHY